MTTTRPSATEAHAAVATLLRHIGEDPNRDGLRDTPSRVAKALLELTQGYSVDVGALLAVQFAEVHDSLIVVRDVPFHSLCEHHMLPFTGTATVGYVPAPGGGIVGLSKLARLVDAYARRLQVQERLTVQIADAIEEHLHPVAVGVIITAHHTCMSMRGIQRAGQMVTSHLTGELRSDPVLRAEFMRLHQ